MIAPTGEKKKTKITRISVVDQVANSIKEDVTNGVWNPGDKLPTEAEFSEIFGVNRLSVRMALQKLSTLGIIETRVGEGSFVCKFSLRPVLDEITGFYEGEESLVDVRQLRKLLEYECMRMAVHSATEDEKEALRQALEAFQDYSAAYLSDVHNDELLRETVEADFNFHYQVIKMSHNQLYKDVYFMVQQLVRAHITHLLHDRAVEKAEIGEYTIAPNDSHLQIYQCVMNSDESLLREATDAMFYK